MGMFFGENEDDIARRKAENDDKSMFFSESDDDIARRKVLNLVKIATMKKGKKWEYFMIILKK